MRRDRNAPPKTVYWYCPEKCASTAHAGPPDGLHLCDVCGARMTYAGDPARPPADKK